MPNSGFCVPVCLCAERYIANDCGDRSFSFAVSYQWCAERRLCTAFPFNFIVGKRAQNDQFWCFSSQHTDSQLRS